MRVIWFQILLPSEMVSDCQFFVFLNSLVWVPARITDITCMAQVTTKMMQHALLIHQGRLVFPYFYFILDLSTCVHRTNIYFDLSTDVTELFAYCVCRFLTLKGNSLRLEQPELLASQILAYVSLQTLLTR